MYRSLTKNPPFTRKFESKLNTVELVDKLWTQMMLADTYIFVYAYMCGSCIVYIPICTYVYVQGFYNFLQHKGTI